MARLGFNVVRLGMTWSGLEPGTAPANDPAICTRGTPDQSRTSSTRPCFDRYVARLRATVDLLGRFHIFTILDMHQDVYNEMFEGEGAPAGPCARTACRASTRRGAGRSSTRTRARGSPSATSGATTSAATCRASTTEVWGDVARAFRGNPWILGYDPFNEPFSTSLVRFGDAHFDAQLECFYTGTAHIGAPAARRAGPAVPEPATRPTASCPPSWPTTPRT